MRTDIRFHGPILLIIRGIPGAGKSHIAAKLQKMLGAAIILDPDAIDKAGNDYTNLCRTLSAKGVDPKLYPYRFLRANAYNAITDHNSIIWNQAFTDFEGLQKTINRLQAFAAEHTIELPVLIVEVEVDVAIARQRVVWRESQGDHGVPEEVFDHFVKRYKSFAGKGYPTVTVSGEGDVAQSVATVAHALATL